MSLGVAIQLNYFRCSTDTEPYVYVQTYDDIFKLLTNPVMRLAESNPLYYRHGGSFHSHQHLSVSRGCWAISRMSATTSKNNSPGKMDGDFLVVQEDRIAEVEKKLHESYFTEPLTIRPYQDTSKLYLNAKTFRQTLPRQTT